MSRIHILPEEISNRIAAGEVIERPASVVKELVENALDAGAAAIAIRIEEAGRTTVAVTDDGGGMDADDALLCLQPHATSKVTCAADIERILTNGFRGEALPSIAAVSRFRLRTRPADAPSGTEVIVEGGRFAEQRPVGCAPGSEVLVQDLFFNTPARRKFLATNATEERHIQETVCLLALGNPETAFTLHLDGREAFHSPADRDLTARLRVLLGRACADHLLPMEHAAEGMTVRGFIARHGFTRNARREQRIFVNGRPIDSAVAYQGIAEGYGSLVMKGRYPPAVLFIDLDPGRVDVNVHPAKREVRFREPFQVRAAVAAAVRETLRHAETPTVALGVDLPLQAVLAKATVHYQPAETRPTTADFAFAPAPAPAFPTAPPASPVPAAGLPPGTMASGAVPQPGPRAVSHETAPPPPSAPPPATRFPEVERLEMLGALGDTYLVGAAGDGLVLFDQHAAHERVLFERLMAAARNRAIPCQQLLLPVTLDLSRSERRFLERHAESFSMLGFDLEPFGEETVIVRAIPAALAQDDIAGLFSDLLHELAGEAATPAIDLADLARAACHHAVRAQDHLSPAEVRSLIRQLAACELPFSCPHGRPTMIHLSLREIERRFGRRGPTSGPAWA
jgi:DNA mismatch repair protein MutL